MIKKVWFKLIYAENEESRTFEDRINKTIDSGLALARVMVHTKKFSNGNLDRVSSEDLEISKVCSGYVNVQIPYSAIVHAKTTEDKEQLWTLWKKEHAKQNEELMEGKKQVIETGVFQNDVVRVYMEWHPKSDDFIIVCENNRDEDFNNDKVFKNSYVKAVWEWLNKEYQNCSVEISFASDFIDIYSPNMEYRKSVANKLVKLPVTEQSQITELEWSKGYAEGSYKTIIGKDNNYELQ